MAEELTTSKNLMQRLREYTSDVRVEMKRVTWPSKPEVYSTTIMVIFTTFAFGLFFWVCDEVFSNLVGKVLGFFLRHG